MEKSRMILRQWKYILYTFGLLLLILNISQAQNIHFSTDSIITTGYKPFAIVCSDFNGDNYPDVAVAIQNEVTSDPVTIFLNDGTGKIITTPDSMYLNNDDPKGLAAGDLNNDQIEDLAVSIYEDSTVLILLGNGDGKFTKSNEIHTPTKPGPLLIADLDKDMNNDLAVVSRYGYLMTFSGNGQGGFSESSVRTGIGTAEDIKACDLNRDGFLDLLAGTGNVHAIPVFFNDETGNFSDKKNIPTYRPSWFVDTADFNRDTYPDIVAGSGSWDFDNVYLLLDDSEGNYTCPDTLTPGTYVADISVGDYNNDKNPDVLVADRNGLYIMNGNGDGHFSCIDTIAYDPGVYQAKAAQSIDIDNDGRLDLVIAREQQISVYYNTGPFTSINQFEQTPSEFRLFQNYPNPFNPSTTIQYQINEPGVVDLSVFNILGQKIKTLSSGQKTVGSYGIQFDASGLSSGIYFYRLKTKNECMYRKMQLIK